MISLSLVGLQSIVHLRILVTGSTDGVKMGQVSTDQCFHIVRRMVNLSGVLLTRDAFAALGLEGLDPNQPPHVTLEVMPVRVESKFLQIAIALSVAMLTYSCV